VTLFVLNRNLEQAMPLEVALSGLGRIGRVETALQLRHRSLKATNTKEHPERVAPAPLKGVEVKGDRVSATLAPASWNVLRVQTIR
jgi:alpha-N-arabinofuranosidase